MKKEMVCRVLFYIGGMLLLALGITLNTRTNLGVSPIISVAFCVSRIIQTDVGDMTLLWYTIFVFIEMICHIGMKRYRAIGLDILQIPLSIIFTRFMNLFSSLIPDMTGNLVSRVIWLAFAIVLTGLGIVFTLNMRLIPNPGDGIVQALSDCSGKKVSLVKNLLDATCVATTILIGFIFSGGLIGIGIGTVLAVIFVGRVVAVGNYLFKNQITKMSGVKSD